MTLLSALPYDDDYANGGHDYGVISAMPSTRSRSNDVQRYVRWYPMMFMTVGPLREVMVYDDGEWALVMLVMAVARMVV